MPRQARGSFDGDEGGLGNLVDLDRDGRAELLYQHVRVKGGEGDRCISSGFQGQSTKLRWRHTLDAYPPARKAMRAPHALRQADSVRVIANGSGAVFHGVR